MKKHSRTIELFGQENFEKLQSAKIILLGVGGVGSFALDALYNSGIENITIVDFDKYDDTNQNRQLGSYGNIGKIKVDVLKNRYENIKILQIKITTEWIDKFDFSTYDLILDAIDDIKPKVHLIKNYHKKVISSGGSARRINPFKIEYISIWKTFNDPFVRKIRNELKKSGFKREFKIIFSSESPFCKGSGSFEGVTGSFGLKMASLAVKRILDKK